MAIPSMHTIRWLTVTAFLLAPIACDSIYTCELGSDPDPRLPHEPEIGYETNEGRYTLTIISSDPWPLRAGEVRFELWPDARDDGGVVRLTAAPAFRSTDSEGKRLTIPLAPAEPSGGGAWQLGPVELDAGVWHVPLQVSDDRGQDAIELRIEVVDR